jgi:hypothetical protein
MKPPLLIDPVVNSAFAAVKPKSAIRPCEGFGMTTVRLALALPIVTLLIAASASAQVPHDCPRRPNAQYKIVESEDVKERLGRLAKYYDRYPCERVDGKTVYELIRLKFLAMAGAKEWQRLLLLSAEGPMTVHTEYGANVASYLAISLCKPRVCDNEKGAILIMDEEGSAGRHIEIAGVCFFRSSAANMEYDLYSDGVIVRAKTKTAPAYPCNPTQLLSVTRGFYPPE